MQILASSVTEAVEPFLHAGYISAYPRALRPDAYPVAESKPVLELDVAESLRLKGEALSAAASSSGGAWPSALNSGLAAAIATAVITAFFMLAAWLLWRHDDRRRLSVQLVALLGTSMIALVGACKIAPAPWEGVERRAYEHPAEATAVLLHGIIADGIINHGSPVQSLSEIQQEVGLPLARLTEGQKYALRTYGIDGWGRELQLVAGEQTTVTSAGPDGQFGTPDDLSVAVSGCDDETWDTRRHAFFVLRDGPRYVVAFHRWTGGHFQYRNEPLARRLTGGGLFDVLAAAELEPRQRNEVASIHARVAAAVGREPVVLQIF